MIVDHILRSKGTDVVCIPSETKVGAVVDLLCERRIGALIVSDADEKVLGVISERDIIRGMQEQGAKVFDMVASELMSREVHSVMRQDSVDHVMALMTDRRIRHLPVVEGGVLMGVISIGDVVKHKIAKTEQEAQALREYITG